jgi:hypothetical protein
VLRSMPRNWHRPRLDIARILDTGTWVTRPLENDELILVERIAIHPLEILDARPTGLGVGEQGLWSG